MALPQSKVTAQGQISVPAEIRRKFGFGPGTVLEWEEQDNHVVLRKKGRFTSEEMHRILFPTPPAPRTLEELKQGIRNHLRKKHARR